MPAMPRHLKLSPDGQYLYVGLSENPGGLVQIRLETLKIEKVIRFGAVTRTFTLSPDGKRGYAVNYRGGSVSVIDLERGKELGSLKLFRGPIGLDTSPDGKRLVVTSSAANSVAIVDIAPPSDGRGGGSVS